MSSIGLLPKNTKNIKYHHVVIFDLDGTLIDSSPGIIDAYDWLCDQLHEPRFERELIKTFIGPSIDEVLKTEFSLSGPALIEAKSIFRSRYQTCGLLNYSKYEGIDQAIQLMTQDDLPMYVVTNKAHLMAIELINHAEWNHSFNGVYGNGAETNLISKIDLTLELVAKTGISPENIVMVADRGKDIRICKDLGVKSIAVSWGFGDKKELESASPDRIISHPNQIHPTTREIFG